MTEVNLVTTTHADDPADKVVSSDGRHPRSAPSRPSACPIKLRELLSAS
jgi:hypothetical protein